MMITDAAPALDYVSLLHAAEALHRVECERLTAVLRDIQQCVQPHCALCAHCRVRASTALTQRGSHDE